MPYLWDYDLAEVKKSKSERAKIFLLERQINYGVNKDEKINLSQVKKYWNKLQLFPRKHRLENHFKKEAKELGKRFTERE